MRASVIEVDVVKSLYIGGPPLAVFQYPARPFAFRLEEHIALSVEEAIDQLTKRFGYELMAEKNGMSLLLAPQEPQEDDNKFFKVEKFAVDKRAWVIPEIHPAFNAALFVYRPLGNVGYMTRDKYRLAETSMRTELSKNFAITIIKR